MMLTKRALIDLKSLFAGAMLLLSMVVMVMTAGAAVAALQQTQPARSNSFLAASVGETTTATVATATVTPDCGPAWRSVPSPNEPQNGKWLNDVAGLSPDDMWAVGVYTTTTNSERHVLIEHWDGSAWSLIPGPDLGTQESELYGVTAIAPDDIWAVGIYGSQTLTVHWDGDQWERVPSPIVQGASGGYLYSLAALSANDIWAVGMYIYFDGTRGRDLTLTLHWDGAQWSIVPSPNSDVEWNFLYDIAAISSNDVWAVGRGASAGSPSHPLILHWNGALWSIVPAPVVPNSGANILYGVDAVSAQELWAVGYFTAINNTNHRTLVQRWNGTQWSIVPSPNGLHINRLNDITAISRDDIWAAGTSGGSTLVEHWDGNEWSIVPSPSQGPGSILEAVTALSPTDIWAVGYQGIGGGSTPFQGLTAHYSEPCQMTTATPTPTSTSTPTLTVTATSATPSVTPTATPTATSTTTLTAAPTNTATAMSSHTATPTSTVTATRSATATTVPTSTYTPTNTRTSTTTSTPTSTSIATATPSNTSTPVDTATNTPQQTSTSQATGTATGTGVPPTAVPCLINFTDVPEVSTFYTYVRCLACRSIISGYSDGTFRPNYEVTRGQLAKIVSNAAAFTENPNPQIFEDVPLGSTFYEWVNRLTRRGYMSGYPCGGTGEPCTTGMPYFRPFANATRGQTSKIVSNTAGYTEIPTDQTFEDVPPTHTFYMEIQRLASRNIMGGYPCGGVGEPCISGRPYFRPQNNVTRGQSAKIVANTFYPGCETP